MDSNKIRCCRMNTENITTVGNRTIPGYDYSVADYILGVGTPLLALTAAVFNGLTLFVMSAFCDKIRSHYVLIVVQCSADLLAAISYLVFYLVPNDINKLLPPLHGHFYCISRWFIDMINGSFALSLLNILAMTLDRLLAVHSPLKYPAVARTSRMKIIAIVMAGISLILSVVPFFAAATRDKPDNLTLCVVYYQSFPAIYKVDEALIALDTLVMIVGYSYIMDQVRRSPANQFGRRSMYRTTMTSFWIIVTFMTFYWPDVISNYVDFPLPVHYVIKTLPLVNCVADPLIYAIRLRMIKTGFEKLYTKLNCLTTKHLVVSKEDGQE